MFQAVISTMEKSKGCSCGRCDFKYGVYRISHLEGELRAKMWRKNKPCPVSTLPYSPLMVLMQKEIVPQKKRTWLIPRIPGDINCYEISNEPFRKNHKHLVLNIRLGARGTGSCERDPGSTVALLIGWPPSKQANMLGNEVPWRELTRKDASGRPGEAEPWLMLKGDC